MERPVRKMMRRIRVMERKVEGMTVSSSLCREMILEICFSLSEGWDRVILVYIL